MTAIDLIAWTQTILLHDQPALAKAEPKTLRYRLLHVAARLVRGGRRTRLKIDRTWRWAHARPPDESNGQPENRGREIAHTRPS